MAHALHALLRLAQLRPKECREGFQQKLVNSLGQMKSGGRRQVAQQVVALGRNAKHKKLQGKLQGRVLSWGIANEIREQTRSIMHCIKACL